MGQGRFKEELDFARDCNFSGYTPVLLVLDPTLSARLEELAAEYSKYGGSAFIGNAAWKHIEDKAGTTMGKFVEKYVRIPLREVDASYKGLAPIHISSTEQEIFIQIGRQGFSIARNRLQTDYGADEDNELDSREE